MKHPEDDHPFVQLQPSSASLPRATESECIRLLLQNLPDPIFVLDENLNLILTNEALQSRCREAGAIVSLGKPYRYSLPFLPEDYDDELREALAQTYPRITPEVHGRGSQRHITEVRKIAFTSRDGQRFLAVVLAEVSPAHCTHLALGDQDHYLGKALAHAQHMLYYYDFKLDRYTYVGPQVEAVLGETVEEFLAKRLADTERDIHPDDLPLIHAKFDPLCEIREFRKESLHLEYRRRAKSGEYRWISDCNTLFLSPDGPQAMVGSAYDITASKQREEELRESEQMYRLVVETQLDLICQTDGNGRLTYVSPSYCEMFGKTKEELIGQRYMPLVHEDDRAHTLAAIEAMKNPPHTCYVEQRVMSQRGWRWVAWRDQAVLDSQGNFKTLFGLGRDITDKKKAEEQLRRRLDSERLISTISSSLTSPDDLDVAINTALREMGTFFHADRLRIYLADITGKTVSAAMQWSASDPKAALPEHGDIHTDEFYWSWPQFKNNETISLPDKTAAPAPAQNDRLLQLVMPQATLAALPLLHAEHLLGFLTLEKTNGDTSEPPNDPLLLRLCVETIARVIDNQMTRDRLLLLFSAVNQSSQGLAIANPAGLILFVNHAFADMHGHEPEWFVGRDFRVVCHKDQWEDLERLRHEVLADTEAVGELIHLRSDGTEFPCVFRASRICDHLGRPVGIVGTFTDITREKLAQEDAHRHQSELAHVGRLTTMGEMASGLAHEINQPLCAIASYAASALRLFDQPQFEREDVVNALKEVADQAERAGNIIRRVRGFVRKQTPERSPCRIDRIIKETLHLAGYELRRAKVTVTENVPADCPEVMVDQIQVEQVLLNLIRNAIDAMQESSPDDRRVGIRVKPGQTGYLTIEIRDNGRAVAQDELEQIFQTFYTTKAHGMGMGLAISQSIIENHGGKLTCHPNHPQGMTFAFTLPISLDEEPGR